MKKTIAAFGLLLLVAACSGGSGDKDNNKDDGRNGDAPKCSTVWQAGKTLPKGYGGCILDDGTIEGVGAFECGDGTLLHQHDDMWAIEGQEIHQAMSGKVEDDPAYAAAYQKCNA